MARNSLPSKVKDLFWDLDAGKLRWDRDRDQIIGRILAFGTGETIGWLQAQVGDEGLREWIQRHEGRGLNPQQLRYWELILDLSHREVSEWLKDDRRQVWDRRSRR